jgi:hypothetical protein
LLGDGDAVVELVVGEPLVEEEGKLDDEGSEDGEAEAEAEDVDDPALLLVIEALAVLLAAEDGALVLELEALLRLLEAGDDDDPLVLLLLPTLDELPLGELLPLDDAPPLPLDDPLTLNGVLMLAIPLDPPPELEPELDPELDVGDTVTVLDTYTVLAELAGHIMLRWLVKVMTMTCPSASGARHAASTAHRNIGATAIQQLHQKGSNRTASGQTKRDRRPSSKGWFGGRGRAAATAGEALLCARWRGILDAAEWMRKGGYARPVDGRNERS